MLYYFSSPTSGLLNDPELRAITKNWLLSFAIDANHALKHLTKSDKTVLIDSGAFTVWNNGKEPINRDEYLSFIKKCPKHWHFINLDVIPQTGSSKEDIEKCIEQGYQNYLYLQSNSEGRKILPVHHYGESIEVFKKFLQHTEHLCISPANDTPEKTKRKYLSMIFDYWNEHRQKTGRLLKLHALGYSSFDGLRLFPFYSVDSISYTRAFVIIDEKKYQFWSSKPTKWFRKMKIREFMQHEKFVTELWKERGVVYED